MKACTHYTTDYAISRLETAGEPVAGCIYPPAGVGENGKQPDVWAGEERVCGELRRLRAVGSNIKSIACRVLRRLCIHCVHEQGIGVSSSGKLWKERGESEELERRGEIGWIKRSDSSSGDVCYMYVTVSKPFWSHVYCKFIPKASEALQHPYCFPSDSATTRWFLGFARVAFGTP